MKHSILLASLLIMSGSLAACSGEEGEKDNTGGAGGTGGTGGTGGDPLGGSGGDTAGAGAGGSAPVWCDAPTTIFQKEATEAVAGCSGAMCHTAENVATFPPDLTTADPASRLLDVISESVYCPGQIYIDTENPDNSLILKVIEENPSCPDGVIEQMPFGVIRNEIAPLSAAQKQCIKEWVHFVAAQ